MAYGEDEITGAESGPVRHAAGLHAVQILQRRHAALQRRQVLHAADALRSAQHEAESSLTSVQNHRARLAVPESENVKREMHTLSADKDDPV